MVLRGDINFPSAAPLPGDIDFPAPPKRGSKDKRVYFTGLQALLNEEVARGVRTPESLDKLWEEMVAYISEKGLTPSLPYFLQIQEEEEMRPAFESYERIKESVLASDWNYEDKLGALIRVHPEAGLGRSIREIKQAVWLSLSSEEQAQRSEEVESADVEMVQLGQAGIRERQRTTFEATRAPRFGPAFEETRLGLKGPPAYKAWFENRYSTFIRRFTATLPTEAPPATEVEKQWTAFLKKLKPESREEFLSQGAFRRGERPQAFAPPVRTVSF